jgi:iron complex outermembrane recepter protein
MLQCGKSMKSNLLAAKSFYVALCSLETLALRQAGKRPQIRRARDARRSEKRTGAKLMTVRSVLMMGAVFCALEVAAGGAVAQTAPAPSAPAAESTSGGIETVTVTARHRAESIQVAPVAVTALDADQLEKLFVHDMGDLDKLAPNLSIQGVGAIHRDAAVMYSRGIGYNGVDLGQDPAVGLSINGVFPTQNVGMMSNMLDVDEVQMLRGPQGTLFGKNTIGGVLVLTTKQPGDTYDIEASERYGNLGRDDQFVAVDLPVDDTFGIRLSFQREYSDGAFKNEYVPPPGESVPKWLGGDNIKTYRGTFVWKPMSNFESDFVATYMDDHSPSVGGTNGSTPTDYLCAVIGECGYDYGGPHNPYQVYRNFPSGDFMDSTSLSWNNRYHGDGFDIVSVTGYIKDWNNSYSDYDNTALNFFQSTFGLNSRQFSQELRVESNNDDSPFKWVGGAIFTSRIWDGSQVFYSFIPTLGGEVDYAKQLDETQAVFGQADYQVLPGLELTAGIRYTSEFKDVDREPSTNALTACGGTPCYGPWYFSKTWTNTIFHFGADYKIDDQKMVYATYSTGFVAGGFDTRVSTQAETGLPYSPEKAKSYEIGFKSDWLDNHLRANLAAFYVNYSDVQVGAFLPGGSFDQVIVNNAFERAEGLEAELTYIPIERLILSASAGLDDAYYTSFTANVFGTGVANYAALRPAFTPKYSGRLEAQYQFLLGGNGDLTPDVSYSYTTSYYTDLTNSPVGYNHPFGLLDASLTYNDPTGRWKIALWGKNLTDTLYRLAAVPSSGYFTQLYFANPRTFGFDFTIKLDKDQVGL